jgi:hypothetical protein
MSLIKWMLHIYPAAVLARDAAKQWTPNDLAAMSEAPLDVLFFLLQQSPDMTLFGYQFDMLWDSNVVILI